MIGRLSLLITGGISNQSTGKWEIISPTDTGRPIVSWDRDKVRRAGRTGDLVFIEIGRRCQGGPGLVWLYAGREAYPLHETLQRSVVCYQMLCIFTISVKSFVSVSNKWSICYVIPSSIPICSSCIAFEMA